LLEEGAGDQPVSADLAAAAILSIGLDTPPVSSNTDEEISSDDPDQINAEAILSGAQRPDDDSVLKEDDPEDGIRPGEASDGYDPADASTTHASSEQNEEDGRQITDHAVENVLDNLPHAESTEQA